jgi:hypothetical protein
MPFDGVDIPVGEWDYSFTVGLGQCEYVYAAEFLDLTPDPDDFLVEVEVFKGEAE